MKGPEEKEHGAGCSAEWLVDQSRDSVSKGDLYGAKSWLLTAKSLYPKAFAVQVCFCCCCSSNVVPSSTTFAHITLLLALPRIIQSYFRYFGKKEDNFLLKIIHLHFPYRL